MRKTWQGTKEQQEILTSKNYSRAADEKGDVYYVHGWLPIIWLFTDGTWKCEKGSTYAALEDHLKDIADY
jgi:hypothetical protein